MLIGSITNQGSLQGEMNNANGYLTGVITSAGQLGGQVVGLRGLKGDKGDTGDTGATGNGIASVTFVSSSGLVDTYKITFTNGTETTFDVTNGEDGIDGVDGHSPVVTASKVGKVTTVSVDGSAIATINDGNDGQNGSDGQDGADGYSPSASVSKSGSIATITITDKNGTTTASVSDGSGVPSGGTTGQVLTKDSGTDYDVSWGDPSGGTITDVTVDGTSIVDDGVAELETATQLRNGLMTALDKQKLDGIASGAEVNVQSDWNEADNTKDDFIKNKPTIPSKTSDLNNDSGFITGMEILSYGNSTWQNFIDAYNANKVVYCRASSNADPATGSQTRLAFMAYVNNATTPTEVEFQYYRSIATHSAAQQGDQVFVYKLTKTGGWSVTTREAASKITAGTNMSSSYSSGTLTLSADLSSKQDTLVSGTNIKTINNTSLLGSGDITVSGTFYAEYGVTTYQEVLDAYESGKSIICRYFYPDSAEDPEDISGYEFAQLEDYTKSTGENDGQFYFTELVYGGACNSLWLTEDDSWDSEYEVPVTMPTINSVACFDYSAKMNSTDMTSQQVETFVDSLDISGGGGILDTFYPVGTLYETVDNNFNPVATWGGIWQKSTQVREEKDNLYSGNFTSGSASLNSRVQNYYRLEITYATNDGDISTLEVVNNYSDTFVVSVDKTRIVSAWYEKAIYVTFSGLTMSSNNNKQAYFSTVSANGTYITIKNVDGYNQIPVYVWKRTA